MIQNRWTSNLTRKEQKGIAYGKGTSVKIAPFPQTESPFAIVFLGTKISALFVICDNESTYIHNTDQVHKMTHRPTPNQKERTPIHDATRLEHVLLHTLIPILVRRDSKESIAQGTKRRKQRSVHDREREREEG